MLAWMGGKRSKLKHARNHHRPRHASGRSAISKAGSKRPATIPINSSLNHPPKRTAEDVSESDKQLQASSEGAQTANLKTAKQSQANFSSTSSESDLIAREELVCLADDIGPQLDVTSPEKLLSSDQTLSTTAGKAIDKYSSDHLEACPHKQRRVFNKAKAVGGQANVCQAALSLDLQAIELPK